MTFDRTPSDQPDAGSSDPGAVVHDEQGSPAVPGATVEARAPGFGVPVAPVRTPGRRGMGGSPLVLAVALVAVLAGSALFVSGFTLGRQAATTPGTPAAEAEEFRAFWDAYRAITERYAGGDVDRKALIEGAIKGMIDSLEDPYSSYLSSEEYRLRLQGISGEFEGIGAEIGTVDPDGQSAGCSTLGPECRLVIVSPIEGSPAQRAGLRPGDIVTAADGLTLDGLTVSEARDRIRGPRDTEVVLTIIRDGGAPFDVPVVRDLIVQQEVIERDLAGGTIGYVKLTGFSEHASDEFAEAIAEDVAAGRKKIIVDLRGNPGGFVTAAREVASQFLGSGTIYWNEDAEGNQTESVAEAGGAATSEDIEVVVLVDRGSASASEIVAGALKDRGRATLVGETTFGKGTVQQWTQLGEDHGGFQLTVAKWLTPNKTWVHGTGVSPDVEVTEQPAAPGDDPVLDRALEILGAGAATGIRRAA